LQLCERAHYRATRKNLDSRTKLDEPAECASGGETLLLYKILHLLFIPLVQYKFFAHYALRAEKNYQHSLDVGPLVFQFLRRGHVSTTHSELCRFVSGSKAKHQVSSTVIILLKKFLSASVIAIMSWQDVTRSSLCSGV